MVCRAGKRGAWPVAVPATLANGGDRWRHRSVNPVHQFGIEDLVGTDCPCQVPGVHREVTDSIAQQLCSANVANVVMAGLL